MWWLKWLTITPWRHLLESMCKLVILLIYSQPYNVIYHVITIIKGLHWKLDSQPNLAHISKNVCKFNLYNLNTCLFQTKIDLMVIGLDRFQWGINLHNTLHESYLMHLKELSQSSNTENTRQKFSRRREEYWHENEGSVLLKVDRGKKKRIQL
jgi:hypothetical protein